MFTNNRRQEERTGKSGTPRLQYLQELVSQFQNATSEESKEKVVANLANFAYDPYNYTFLRQLNVLELFLDCISEPNEKLVEFGVGGICNSCADPANAAIVTQCGGIPLIIQCLSSPVRNTVNHALGALYFLCNAFNKDEILSPEVIDVIERYTAAGRGSQVQFTSPDECRYPRTPALVLGLTAVMALVLAQVIINIETGCICCRRGPRPSNSNWTVALICFVISWFTFVIAFLLLLTSAALNDEHGEESMYFGNYYCYVVKPGVFAGGSVLSLASVVLGLIYYFTLTSAKNTNPWGNSSLPNQGGIAMGQPQFPPQNTQEPVFVHEDTYIRRQVT